MTAAIRLALTLVASLLLWLPMIPAALAGNESPESIALRYLLALVVARAGVGILIRVIGAYATPVLAELEAAPDDGEPEPEPEADAEPVAPRRRRDDDSPAQADDLSETLDDAEDATALAS